METVTCNFCGSQQTQSFLKDVTSWEHAGKFTLVQCSQCRLIFLNPRPKRNEIGQYYPAESYWGHNIGQKADSVVWKKERQKAYGFLYRLLRGKNPGKILDIGAGTGLFLSYFLEKNWQVNGVEFSADAVRFAKTTFGISLKKGDFLDFRFPANTYDVVTLNNALEHVFDPAQTLQKIHNTLRENGLVVITVPNIASLGFSFFGANWYALQPPRHLYHFSPETLTALVEKAGFTVEEIRYGYWEHNYAALFESFRLKFSPRFEKKQGGGLQSQEPTVRPKRSLKKEIGKQVMKFVAAGLAVTGTLTGHSETICLIAKKSK